MFDEIVTAAAAARTPGAGVRACARLENAACSARLRAAQGGEVADIDHTIAYPFGLTCASNPACLCREHRRHKTPKSSHACCGQDCAGH